MKQTINLTIYATDRIGLLLRITQIISRKNINIDKLTVHNTPHIPGIIYMRYTIDTDIKTIINLVKQIEKQIEVQQVFYLEEKTNSCKQEEYIKTYMLNESL